MNILMEPVAIVNNRRDSLTDDFSVHSISAITLLPDISDDIFNNLECYAQLDITCCPNKVADKRICRVELIEREGRTLWVRYLDAIDNTPVLNVAPVVKQQAPIVNIKQKDGVGGYGYLLTENIPKTKQA